MKAKLRRALALHGWGWGQGLGWLSMGSGILGEQGRGCTLPLATMVAPLPTASQLLLALARSLAPLQLSAPHRGPRVLPGGVKWGAPLQAALRGRLAPADTSLPARARGADAAMTGMPCPAPFQLSPVAPGHAPGVMAPWESRAAGGKAERARSLPESGHGADTGIPLSWDIDRSPGHPAPTCDIPLPAQGMPQATVSPEAWQPGPTGTQTDPELVAPAQDLAGTGPAPPWSSTRARPSSLRLRSCVPGREEAFYLLVLFLARRCPAASASPGREQPDR